MADDDQEQNQEQDLPLPNSTGRDKQPVWNKKKFARLVRHKRKLKGLTQEELAEQLGVIADEAKKNGITIASSVKSVQRWEDKDDERLRRGRAERQESEQPPKGPVGFWIGSQQGRLW